MGGKRLGVGGVVRILGLFIAFLCVYACFKLNMPCVLRSLCTIHRWPWTGGDMGQRGCCGL